MEQPEYFTAAPLNKEKSLKYNMNSSDVKNAQIILQGLGYKPGREDGYFDKVTESSVIAFQKQVKLTASGIIDAKTAAAMEAKLIEKIRDPKNDNQLKQGIEEIRKEMKTSVAK